MAKLSFSAVKRFVDIPDPFDLVIDPSSPQFKRIKPVCNPENPTACLVATLGRIQGGHRTTFNFDHTADGPTNPRLRISLGGGYSAVKTDVSPGLLDVASRFDQGTRIRKGASEHIDLSDGSWTFEYRESKGGVKNDTNNKGRGKNNATIKYVRAKTLRDVRKSFEA